MNPEVKEKWVSALRSGNYAQGKGQLRRRNSFAHTTEFCCLGVVCEIAKAEGITELADFRGGGIFPYAGSNYPDARYGVPLNVMAWMELPGSPGGPVMDDYAMLANMNDHGKTFAEIADYIEENL